MDLIDCFTTWSSIYLSQLPRGKNVQLSLPAPASNIVLPQKI